MSSTLEEKERVHKLLADALPLLCKNAVHFDGDISIEALVGITIDQDKVLLVSIKKDFQKERIPKAVSTPLPSRRQMRQQQQQQQRLQQQQKQQQQLLRQQQLLHQQQWLLDFDDDEDEEDEEEEDEVEEWQRQTLIIHQQRQQQLEQKQTQEDTLMRIRQAALTAATGGSMSAMRKLRNQELPKRRNRDPPPASPKTLNMSPLPNRMRKSGSTVTSSSDQQSPPVKRQRCSAVPVKQPMVLSIKKENEVVDTYTGVYVDSQPPPEITIKTEVKEEPRENKTETMPEEKAAQIIKKVKAEPKQETETEQAALEAAKDQDEEEEEEEEEEEFYEGKTNQLGEDEDGSEVASKLLDIPVRIPATEVKKHFRIVKGETVDDEGGTQSQTAAYCCNKCGKTYESEIAIEDHILVSHMKILRYSCHLCGQHFGFRSALTSHLREDHDSESHT